MLNALIFTSDGTSTSLKTKCEQGETSVPFMAADLRD
jgi:hypothetical protein